VSFLLLKCTAAVKCKWLIRKIVRVAVRRLFFYLAAAAGEWWEREMMIRWYTRHPSTCMAANFAASARALSLGGSFSFILAHSLGAAASYLKCANGGDVREKLLSNRKISYGIFNTLCTQAHTKILRANAENPWSPMTCNFTIQSSGSSCSMAKRYLIKKWRVCVIKHETSKINIAEFLTYKGHLSNYVCCFRWRKERSKAKGVLKSSPILSNNNNWWKS
jgi:hypothetical protein